MRKIVLAAITIYRRHLSPIKGFSCAMRIHGGRESCSAYGYRVIERCGVLVGLALLRRRLHACAEQHRRHQQPDTGAIKHNLRFRRQAGFCDIPCGDCNLDISNCDGVCDVVDIVGNCKSGKCTPWEGKRRDENRYAEKQQNTNRY